MSEPKKHLGKQSEIPTRPDINILEAVPNPMEGVLFSSRFTVPEFTSLCPVTGQPDFATLTIDMIPRQFLVESKSLKLYCFSFRNHGSFHEACTVRVGTDIASVVRPLWLRVAGIWYPRGGIPIDVFFTTGKLPEGVFVPEVDVRPFRGR